MNKYIFRIIFYFTIILSGFALGIDYDKSEFSSIVVLLGLIGFGVFVSYNVLHNKTIKEIHEIIGIPKNFISE